MKLLANPDDDSGRLGVRPADAADVATLWRVVLDAWTGTVDPRSSGHSLRREEVEEWFLHGGAFLAERSGVAVGSIAWLRAGDTVEIAKLAVIPRARGQRIAPKLVAAVESCAAGIGARQLLLAVSAYSPSLVGWYERLGYLVDENARYLHASPTSPPPFVLVKRVAS